MRRRFEQSGMTLLEVLVALATVLILISAMLGVGGYIKTQANINLTRGMLETLCTALTQYHDDTGGFPFDTPDSLPPDDNGFLGDDYDVLDLQFEIDPGGGVVSSGTLPTFTSAQTTYLISSASSAGLFYFLDKNSVSRPLADAVASSLVTNKDNSGTAIMFRPAGAAADGSEDFDLPRYIDPWGTSIRYVYLSGTAFPTLRSAGPDEVFDTPDDITSE